MSNFEQLIRSAIEIKKADSKDKRLVIYEAARNSISSLPQTRIDLAHDQLDLVIKKIESEFSSESDYSDEASAADFQEDISGIDSDRSPADGLSNNRVVREAESIEVLDFTDENNNLNQRLKKPDLMSLVSKVTFNGKFLIAAIFVIVLALLLIFGGLFSDRNDPNHGEQAMQNPVPVNMDSEITPIAKIDFFNDKENLILERDQKTLDANLEFSGKTKFQVSKWINILSKNIFAIGKADLLQGSLLFKLNQKSDGGSEIPTLYSGLYLLDENKTPLPASKVFFHFIHNGPVDLSITPRDKDGVIEARGIAIIDDMDATRSIPENARYFRTFVGLINNSADTSVEFISMEIKNIQ